MTGRLAVFTAALSMLLAGCNATNPSGAPTAGVTLRTSIPVNAPARPMALHPDVVPAATPGPAVAPVPVGYAPSSPEAPYRLGPGDQLRVIVFGQENLSRIYLVDASGFVSLPLIGAVPARGSTTFELEDRIAAALRRKYVKDPKVTVEVERHRPFFILGEVRNAGQYPYVAGMTVQTAVAIAGGFTPRARKSRVWLTRSVNGAAETRKVPLSWPIRPGDTINVKERFF